jgi:hypothetical protein
MAHDNQVHEELDEREYEKPLRPGLCPRCRGTGYPYREEVETHGPFKGTVYSRSSPHRCSCQVPK